MTNIRQSKFSEEQKKGMLRVMEILGANDGGSNAQDVERAAVTKGWELAWQEGMTPWAPFRVKPPLAYLVEHPTLGLPKSGRAFVPGCGHGEDVVLFAKLGFQATGVDSSPTAIQKAKEHIESQPAQFAGRAEVLVENFFSWTPPHEGFNIIYDYTFFCAIPPVLRASWAETMKRVVTPGGFLATLVFPIDGDRADGPPFSVSMDMYRELLKPEDWELALDEVPPGLTTPQVGRTRIAVWKSRKIKAKSML